MSFVHPWILLGVLLGAVPILIHLINRRNARPLDFSALDFLLQSDRKLARNLKLKEWLLLVLRTLLVIAIPIALARPYSPAEQMGFVESGNPRSVVIVLDCSLYQRMLDDQAEGGAILMDRARKQAQALLRSLPAGSTAGVVIAKSSPEPLVPHLTSNSQDLAHELDGIAPSYGAGDLEAAVRAASVLLREEGLGLAEIAVLGRLGDEELYRLATLDLGDIGLTLYPVRRTSAPRNLRILSVRSELSEDGVPGMRVKVDNQQPTAQTTTVTLEMGGQVVRREITLPPQNHKELRFAWSEQGRSGEMLPEIAQVYLDGDDFPPDDRWFLVREGKPRTGVLVINGATSSIPFQDEVFFLGRALEALSNVGIQLSVETVTPDNLKPVSISGRQVLVLANVHLLPMETIGMIRAAVEAGMGLLVSAGDNLDAEFGSRMRDLLPLPYRGVQGGGTRLGEEQGLTIAAIDPRAGSARQLMGKGGDSLKRARVFRYVILSPPSPEHNRVQVWLSLENGAPLLLERPVGLGRMMFLATSLDLDWTDLPAHPGYVQLLGVLLQHLAGYGVFEAPSSILPGVEWAVTLPDHQAPQDLRLRGPTPLATTEVEVRDHDDGMQIVVNNAQHPGIYELWLKVDDERESAKRFAVNVARDPVFPQLASQEVISSVARAPGVVAREVRDDSLPEYEGAVPGTPIWPVVLLALVLLLGLRQTRNHRTPRFPPAYLKTLNPRLHLQGLLVERQRVIRQTGRSPSHATNHAETDLPPGFSSHDS